MADDLSTAKKEFNDLHDLVLPRIKAIKLKQKNGTRLDEVEASALERYERVARLIQEGKAAHLL
jgi:hypothetical protein